MELQGGAQTMSTSLRLLWFFGWRMPLLGSGLGSLLGAIYGVLLPSVMVAGAAVANEGGQTGGAADLLGALLLGAFYGALLGGVVGALAGLVLGLLDGIVLFALARAFYYPVPADAQRYRRTAGATCALTSALAFSAAWAFPFSNPSADFGGFFGTWRVDLALIVIVPTLIAAAAMGLLGSLMATWHTKKTSRAGSSQRRAAP